MISYSTDNREESWSHGIYKQIFIRRVGVGTDIGQSNWTHVCVKRGRGRFSVKTH
jgi:hypothetical protein